MQEQCLNKVKEKFKELKPIDITRHHQYIDPNNTFCFNAAVLDICKGIKKNENGSYMGMNINIGTELLDGVYKQNDTLDWINEVHAMLCDDAIDFDEAVDKVVTILENDGHNHFEATYFPDDGYEDDYQDDYEPDEPPYDKNDLD